jgi:hypothetical protein
MLTRDEPYQDLGPDWLARRNDEAHTRRLVAQLERLGTQWSSISRPPDELDKYWRTGFARPALTRACKLTD